MTQFLQFLGLALLGASCYFFGAVTTAAVIVVGVAAFLVVTVPAYWDR